MNTLKSLFWSSRPVSWINTAYPFALAYWFITERVDAVLVVGTLFFLIPYNLLMYGVNDVFDYESDLRNPRKGGIEGALLDPKLHQVTLLVSAILPMPFLVFLIANGTAWSTGWLLLFVFTVVAYSAKGLRFKEIAVLDSLTSASHFVGPMIFGLALAGADFGDPKILAIIAAFTLWGVASHAFGAVQDVTADRAAGIRSIATFFGARVTTRFALISYLLAGVAALTLAWPGALVAIAVLPYVVIISAHWNITDETCESANRGWRRFIWLNFFAGFVVTMLMLSEQAGRL